ncbi:DUF732 domain-containing protein [Mycolicibacterium smegmatis]|uniref:DUF732 domain-containing protein n=4 Tax=Mycolicibacterium smegmatis TaxID=1772 RepID=I7FUR4_MYCS2|nr:DUF732 domain-containing protein [Mycolicibacterium smegmatis]ABK73852.1 conserved hypothetical protein [Mycolicibacterium smegmatis MC2 155]AFP42653.1 hypothetical protein MSMEI_6227 [Mycolicibacterium smegmatis MC2 155]AIU11376.1 hypothetical protein LJ00_31610 [Mycolicibacterium smegmatis MC2 155]AIU18000.1 hypothetical protein LI99_31615 [Mycolicibacterium smegmatis]AIU24624.1 hypothetical protein LI98_31620 [Mycolicibacterium smegmatis]
MQHTVRSRTQVVALSLAMAAAPLLTACDAGGDMIAPLAVPPSQITDTRAQSGDLPPESAMTAPGRTGSLTLTGQQQGYLDALRSSGVTPSSDLLALSIGSYVCQARAAKQNDQAVWDFVLPLVRSDVRAMHSGATVAPGEVDSATSDYIRIATERLC